MGDLPVLAPGTKEVAAQGTHGQPPTPWIEMEKGLNLDWRYPHGGYTAINQRIELSIHVFSRLAVSTLAWGNFAATLANLALNVVII